jgi:hypothetical protein
VTVVAMLVVLLAQVLPCVIGTPLAATPQAHCHDESSSPQSTDHALAGTPSCKHCVWLAEPPSARGQFADTPAAGMHPDIDAVLSAVTRRAPIVPLRIDKSHPPPRSPLQGTLRHRVLLI